MRNFVLHDFSHFCLFGLFPQTQKTKISSLSYAIFGADNIKTYNIEFNFPTKCRKVKNNTNRMPKSTFRQIGAVDKVFKLVIIKSTTTIDFKP